MNLVLMGPPGSGKGTQAARLARQWNLAHLSTGDILRVEVEEGTEIGRQADALMKAGQLVPDEMIIDIIGGRLSRQSGRNGFTLDGVPRTVHQAEALATMLRRKGLTLNLVLLLKVDDDAMVERISGRFTCAACGAGYHDAFKRPKVDGVCDVCGGTTFVRRPDDKPETVRARLRAYHTQTEPVLEYYRKQGLLRSVDGMKAIDEVTQDLNATIATVRRVD